MTRVVPTMGQAIPGNYETGAFWNANTQALGNFLLSPPMFVGWYGGTPQTIPNATWTHMVLDTEVIDTEGGHDTTSNSQRYTCQVAGVYYLTGCIVFTAGGTGVRGAKFMVNTSTSVPGSEQVVAPLSTVATTIAATPSYARLAVGDYVEIFAYQSSGAGLATASNASGDYACAMSCRWVSA